MELLTPSPKSVDKTNPYNQAFLLTPRFQGYQQEFGSLPQHHLASHRQLVTHPNIQFFPHQGPHNVHYHAQMMPQRQTGHTRMYNPNMGSTPPNVQQFNTVISSASRHCRVMDPQIVSADPSHSGLQQVGEQHVTPRQEFLSPTSLHVSADPCEQGGTPRQELVPPSSLHVSADPCERGGTPRQKLVALTSIYTSLTSENIQPRSPHLSSVSSMPTPSEDIASIASPQMTSTLTENPVEPVVSLITFIN